MKYIPFIVSILLFVSCSTNRAKLSDSEKQAEIYHTHGAEMLSEEKYTEGLEALLKAVELNDKNPNIYNDLGLAYHFKNKDKLAEEHFLKSLKLNPKNSDARNNLASIYIFQNRLDEAEVQLKIVSTDLIFRHLYLALFNLSVIEEKRGNDKKMLEYLQASTRENPEYCEGHFKLGEYYSKKKKYTDALKSFKNSAKGLCVKESVPHFKQVETLIAMKQFAKAEIKLYDIINMFDNNEASYTAQAMLTDLREQKHLDGESTVQAKNKYESILKNKTNEIKSPNF